MNVGGPELILLGIVFLITVLFPIWAIVDIIRWPEWAWERTGKNRFVWLIVMIVGIVACNVAFMIALWYLLFVRPRVRDQAAVGRGIGFPGA